MTQYFFVDESGEPGFHQFRGSQYFILAMVQTPNWAPIEELVTLRRALHLPPSFEFHYSKMPSHQKEQFFQAGSQHDYVSLRSRKMPFKDLLDRGVISWITILWVVSMVILWTVFAIGIVTHPQAWTDVQPVETQAGWNVFSFILWNNFILLTLITLANLFVRFGTVTPGLLILGIQIVTIGWTAGTNGFREPFPSVEAANVAFLRIGLWEITAYISICAITLGKSLLVADTFPAKKWTKITRLKDLTFTRTEVIASVLSVLALLFAAYIEAFFPSHML